MRNLPFLGTILLVIAFGIVLLIFHWLFHWCVGPLSPPSAGRTQSPKTGRLIRIGGSLGRANAAPPAEWVCAQLGIAVPSGAGPLEGESSVGVLSPNLEASREW